MKINKEIASASTAVRAVMLGHAVGDALGVPVEFCSREELDASPVRDMRGWGTYPVPEGCWSDDTSMSLATLDNLKNGLLYEDIMQGFEQWYFRGEYTPTGRAFDVGGTCRAAIERYAAGAPTSQCGLSDEWSNGNGSLMRIHPVALYLYFNGYSESDGLEEIHRASSLTHAHERSRVACGIYALLLWALLDDPRHESIRRALKRASEIYGDSGEAPAFGRLLSSDGEALARTPREDIIGDGYVVHTLEAAVWCLFNSENYGECVLGAVNLGDDTDTTAAVAGGLAGARYGLDKIPDEWLAALKKRDYITEICDRATEAWFVK